MYVVPTANPGFSANLDYRQMGIQQKRKKATRKWSKVTMKPSLLLPLLWTDPEIWCSLLLLLLLCCSILLLSPRYHHRRPDFLALFAGWFCHPVLGPQSKKALEGTEWRKHRPRKIAEEKRGAKGWSLGRFSHHCYLQTGSVLGTLARMLQADMLVAVLAKHINRLSVKSQGASSRLY